MKTVLVALDRTEEAASVLAYATDLARSLGAKLTLLQAVDVPRELPPPSSLVMVLPASSTALVNAARQHLELVAADVPAALRGDVIVQTGAPASVICAVAREKDAEVVVIGAHQHGVVRRALGTTAARVVNHIDRPLLVVRGTASAASDRESRPLESVNDVVSQLERETDCRSNSARLRQSLNE